MIELMPELSGSITFLGKAVGWIINLGILMGSVGLGIIIFTLLIKLVTMPFEIYSRISMKKSSLAMEKLKPQLEKLKAQYKNDEATYRQKSMEIYKKNGFSPFKACLPILITLPLFFIIFSGFNNYSAWANLNNYYDMAQSYNQSIKDLAMPSNRTVTYKGERRETSDSNNSNQPKFSRCYIQTEVQGDVNTLIKIVRIVEVTIPEYKNEGPDINDSAKIQDFFENGYYNGTKLSDLLGRVDNNTNNSDEASGFKYTLEITPQKNNIQVIAQKNEKIKAAINRLGLDINDANALESRITDIVNQVGKDALEAKYREISKTNRFLWVANIWNSDISYVTPLSYESLKKSGLNTESLSKEKFNNFTSNLEYERERQPNGFYIMIFLSAGTLFISQFFLSRQSKTQNDLMQGSGKAAKILQWVPLILIPGMYIWFGFTYSMAYMLYLFLSSAISFASNLVVNKIIEKKFMNNEAKEIQNQYNKRIPKK